MQAQSIGKLALGLSLFAILAAGSAEDSDTSSSEPIDYSSPAYSVNYKALADEFETNSLAAEEKYEGKIIHVSGPIHSIDKDIMGDPYISISGSMDFAMIRCEIAEEDIASTANLAKGQVITVAGIVGDTTVGVSLDKCKLIG